MKLYDSSFALPKIRNRPKWKDRHCVGYRNVSAFVMNRAARKEVVCVLERKRLGKFDCSILPPLANRGKTNARRKPRRDYCNPFACQFSGETDTALCKCSARCQWQIFSTPEKIDVFASKLQDLLCQKHFDPAIRPVPHQLLWRSTR